MKKYTLLLSIIFSFFGAKAQSGFFGTGGGLVIYEANGGGNVNSYNYNQNIGAVQSLFLKGGIIHTWKNGSGNICGGEMYYRVYKDGNPSGTFTSVNLSFSADHTFSTNAIPNNINSGGSGDQRWLNDGLNLNVLSLTNDVGTWVLEVYFRANTCPGEVFYNNSGNNFRILFDVSGFDAFASAINIGNCQSSNQTYNLTGDNVNRFSSTNFGDDLGSFFANSGQLLLQGGQIKTYKSNVSNVCLPRLYYRVFPQGSPSGAFNMLEINQTISSCTGCPGTFNNGSPCNGYNSCNDQMWQRFNAGIDVLALANNIPGSYELQVYFEIPGSINSSSSCSYLKYLSNFGSNFSANFTILPQVTASNDGPYCVGQTIQLNGNSSTSPSWTGPISFSNSTQNPTRSTAIEAMSGEYIFSSTLANGCSQSASTFVTVSNSAVAGSNSPVCAGGALSLTSSSGTSYSWSGPNSFTSSVQNPTVSVSATTAMAGVYTVSIVGACGSTGGVVDNFSDGNFTVNPVWTTELGGWQVSSGYLRGDNTVAVDKIRTPSTQAYGTWNFDFQFQTTSGTSGQVVRVFPIATLTTLNSGYYVFADGAGTFQFRRLDSGTPTTLINSTWIPNLQSHSVKVIRDFDNTFKLYLDGILKGTSAADVTYLTSTFFGVWNSGTAATDNHYIDNISCAPAATATTTVVVDPCLPIQNCNLLVYAVGDGTTSLIGNSNALPVRLLEISQSGSLVQSISSLFIGINLLTAPGSAVSQGFLNSYNGFTAVPGLNLNVNTTNSNTNNNKVTSIINGGVPNLVARQVHSTLGTVPFTGDNYRSVIPTSSTTFYAAGDASNSTKGVWYYDGSDFNKLAVLTARNVEIFNNQLYVSQISAINEVGTGTPTSGTQALNQIVTYASSSIYDFSISPDGCTMYVADNGSSSYRGVTKWTKSTINGTWTPGINYLCYAYGLTVDYSGSSNIIYLTMSTTNAIAAPDKIIRLTDNGSFTLNWTYTAATNYRFAGIDFTPSSTTATSNPISTQPISTASLCDSQTQTLSVTASGSNTYQWYSNTVNSICGATPITGATSTSYTPPVATTSGTTYYFVKVSTNCYNIFYSSIAAVTTTINPLPNASNNSPFCSNQNNTLILSTPNLTGATFSWTGPNSFAASDQNPTVTTNATSVHAGTYNLVTTVNGCSSPSGSTTVIINQVPSIESISSP